MYTIWHHVQTTGGARQGTKARWMRRAVGGPVGLEQRLGAQTRKTSLVGRGGLAITAGACGAWGSKGGVGWARWQQVLEELASARYL